MVTFDKMTYDKLTWMRKIYTVSCCETSDLHSNHWQSTSI